MSEVYVLTSAFDMEGESPLAVFGTLEKAQAAAELIATSYGWERFEWMGMAVEAWQMSNGGSSSFIIRKEVIQ